MTDRFLCLLLIAAVSAQWTNNSKTCTAKSGTSIQYNSCTNFCCNDGTVTDWKSACKCNATSACGSGTSCCSSNINPSGTCYSSPAACCTSGDITYKNVSEVYDPSSRVCCPLDGVVKIDNVQCHCQQDSHCPNGYSCCHDPSNLFENTDANQRAETPTGSPVKYGICYKSPNRCARFPLHRLQAVVYTPTSQQYCLASERLIPAASSCPCNSNSQCGSGYFCCLGPAAPKTANCGTNACADNCRGSCLKSGTACLLCGTTVVTTTNSKCGQYSLNSPTSPGQYASYDSSKYQWCPYNGQTSPTEVCSCLTHDDCPSGQKCCSTDDATDPGKCYQPNREVPGGYAATVKTWEPLANACCLYYSNAKIYNSKYQKCCPHDGVKLQTQRCSCLEDSQCNPGASCCISSYQPPGTSLSCDSTTQGTACKGQCRHNDYEICCSNYGITTVCYGEYEGCCGATCFNKLTERCSEIRNSANPYDDGDLLYQKTTDNRTAARNFWAYGFPSLLLLIYVWIGALTALQGLEASFRIQGPSKVLGLTMTVGAIVNAVFCCVLVYSQLWLTTVLTVFVNFALVLAFNSVGRGRYISFFVFWLSLIYILYMLTPLAITSYTIQFRQQAVKVTDTAACTTFYDYFSILTEQVAGVNNKEQKTFGLCQPGWLGAVSVFGGLLQITQLLVFLGSFVFLTTCPAAIVAIASTPSAGLEAPLLTDNL